MQENREGGVMNQEFFTEVKELTENLVRVPSVVCKEGQETQCAKYIYEYLQRLPYFIENKEQLFMSQTTEDTVVRHNTLAYVKGKKNGGTNKTVILFGHLDTVDVEDFGGDVSVAFESQKAKDYLKGMRGISSQVKEHIESGEYMFGRGCLDMKSGVACQMSLIKYFSENLEKLEGNLVFIGHCDEEDMSHGILRALVDLDEIKEKEGFEYLAAINSDYSTPYYEGDENRYIYLGSVGKLLSSYYVVGQESHVGQPFSALDPNQVMAEITRLMNLNLDMCDEALGETTLPPISLKQADLKPFYSVQTASAAYGYFNFFTHSYTPKDVIEISKKVGIDAMTNVIDSVDATYKSYCNKLGFKYSKVPFETAVYTYEEFYADIKMEHGEKFEKAMKEYASYLCKERPDLDLRLFSMEMIKEGMKWVTDKKPMVIVYFSSSYNARIEISGKTTKEKNLIDAVQKAIEEEGKFCENPIVMKYFFPYISDSSFLYVCDDDESLDSLEKNMPAWGEKYTHKVDAIRKINVPVVNIGSYGMDGHMATERVHEKYTFQNVTNMMCTTISELLK